MDFDHFMRNIVEFSWLYPTKELGRRVYLMPTSFKGQSSLSDLHFDETSNI